MHLYYNGAESICSMDLQMKIRRVRILGLEVQSASVWIFLSEFVSVNAQDKQWLVLKRCSLLGPYSQSR